MISIGDPKDEKNGVLYTIAGDSCSGVPSCPFEPLRNIYYLYIDPLTADIYFPELSSKKVFKISSFSSSTPPKQQQLNLVSEYSTTTSEEEKNTTTPLRILPGSPGELLLVSDSGNTIQTIPISSHLQAIPQSQPQYFSNRNLGHHLQLEAIPSGAGITILGATAGDQLGYSVCVGGDINGDSKADLLLGAPGYSSFTGRAYAIYGSNTLTNMDLSSFASGGITITGAGSANGLGTTVDIGGDANGDGKADMFLAAPTVTTNTGVAYLVYGGASLTNVATGTLGTAGVAFTGAAVNTFASTGLSLNYDNNQDGKADPVIGAYGHNSNQGRTYLVLGSATLTSIGISTLAGDAYGSGPAGTGKSGYSVDSGGDINGDSKTDLMIGPPETAAGGTVFIIFGGANWGNIPGLGGIVSPEGFTITGPAVGCLAGESVSIGGDVNEDGKSDMLIGAPGCSSAAGTVYLVYGSAVPASFTLSGSMTQGVSFTGATAGDQVGSSVAVGGDFNGDEKADILIGAPGYSSNTGIVYLIYGSASLANLALGSFSGSNGIKITGEYGGCFTGFSVSLRDDVNGDGKADILIGAYGYASSKGKVYLIYGTASPTNILLASDTPTYTPTKTPTFQPTFTPSVTPTRTPTAIPTFAPTRTPTFLPTSQPSARPTRQPSGNLFLFFLFCSLICNSFLSFLSFLLCFFVQDLLLLNPVDNPPTVPQDNHPVIPLSSQSVLPPANPVNNPHPGHPDNHLLLLLHSLPLNPLDNPLQCPQDNPVCFLVHNRLLNPLHVRRLSRPIDRRTSPLDNLPPSHREGRLFNPLVVPPHSLAVTPPLS
jgi:hypothetical protein